jgi:aminopeptidase N
MKKVFKVLLFYGIALVAASTFITANAQTATATNTALETYRASATKINDLVHTKLDVRFDYRKCYLYGREWVTLQPHFYPADTLRLDAKGMDLKNIAVVKSGKNIPLKFLYDGLTVAIQLDRVYHHNEPYTIYIEYVSKPNELTFKDSSLARYNKGLYFINPDSTEKGKPVQVYTQGETENASAWFPTIDKPNQKTTSEINMTVPGKYTTLSNGRLAGQKNNADGTRTDTWKMELPQPPYLFMMAVGDFRIVKDYWRDKEVSYYLEPAFAPYAKQIFGMTPEIIDFFSKILAYDFPWNKYSQIVVRDYASGGMENTTATLLNEYVQQTPRELLDAYYDKGRSTIVHELFHQWFGALVTCKSWSNQAVDETFAEFSDVLWAEYKYGKDEADAHRDHDLRRYLNTPGAAAKDMVRFHYGNELDMFDVVTYDKGNCILNMLRNYLGDAAFFKGLNIYLKTNAFKNGEVQQLRLAFEEACGLDLNWYFNQWYYGAGHPELNINCKWNDTTKTETVDLQQTQHGQLFRLPMAVDIYASGKKERYKICMDNKSGTFRFPAATKPDLVNVDGDKVLLASITDNKTMEEFAFQYFNAPLYIDRLEALNAAATHQPGKDAKKVLIAALHDKYYGLRINAITALNMNTADIRNAAIPVLTALAQTDTNTLARAAAITALGKLKTSEYLPIFNKALDNRSYAVQGAALIAINLLDPARALALAKGFETDNKGALTQAIHIIYAASGSR